MGTSYFKTYLIIYSKNDLSLFMNNRSNILIENFEVYSGFWIMRINKVGKSRVAAEEDDLKFLIDVVQSLLVELESKKIKIIKKMIFNVVFKYSNKNNGGDLRIHSSILAKINSHKINLLFSISKPFGQLTKH